MREIGAKVLVNAAGPWVAELTDGPARPAARRTGAARQGQPHHRADASSRTTAPTSSRTPTSRIVFAIPYERDFTLIGTTDLDYDGDPGEASRRRRRRSTISARRRREYFRGRIAPADVVWTYAGVRPLYDDGASEAQAATRDYVLKVEGGGDVPPVLNIYGGKITTYRRLAEAALEKLAPFFDKLGKPWTAQRAAAGRRFPGRRLRSRGRRDCRPLLPVCRPAHARRLVRAYGTRARTIVDGVSERGRLGRDIRRGPDGARGPLPDGARMGAHRRRRALAPLQARPAPQPQPRRGGSTTGCRRRAPPAHAPRRWREERAVTLELRHVTKTRAQRDAHRRRVAHLRARHAEHPARADALRQDQPDAADGRARRSRPKAASSSTART